MSCARMLIAGLLATGGATHANATAFCPLRSDLRHAQIMAQPNKRSLTVMRVSKQHTITVDTDRPSVGSHWVPVVVTRGPARKFAVSGWLHEDMIEPPGCG